jgi:hypothetical protein
MAIFIVIIKYEDNGMNIDKTVFPRRNSQIYLCLWLYMDTINRENIIIKLANITDFQIQHYNFYN